MKVKNTTFNKHFQVTTELELVKLRVTSAMGAAWLASRHVNYTLPRDDTALCQVFYTHTPDAGHYGSYTNGANSNINSVRSNTNGINSNTNNVDSNTNGVNSNKCEADSKLYENGFNSNADKLNGDHLNGIDCGCDKWRNWRLL